jgi:anti-anti-sigma regulatory factor
MAGRKKKPASVLGDDPLSWLGKDEPQQNHPDRPEEQPGPQTAPADGDENPAVAAGGAHKDQAPVRIVLDPVITLSEVSPLREKLLGHVGAHQIQIDVSQVEHIDTAGMQLLLAFSKAVQEQGGVPDWQGWSAAYAGTAELLGLTKLAGVEKK